MELKRRGRARIQTEMVEFIAFPLGKLLNFGHFLSLLCRDCKEMYKKACRVVVFPFHPTAFFRSRCCRRRARSLAFERRGREFTQIIRVLPNGAG